MSYKINNKQTKKVLIPNLIVNLDVVKKPHSKNSVLYIQFFFLKNFTPIKFKTQKSNVIKKIFWNKNKTIISNILQK